MPSGRRDSDDANVLFFAPSKAPDTQYSPDFNPLARLLIRVGADQEPCCLPLDLLPRLRRRFLRFLPVCGVCSSLFSPVLRACGCVVSDVCGAVSPAVWGSGDSWASSTSGLVAGVWASSGGGTVAAESFSVIPSPSSAPHPGSSASALALGSGFGAGVGLDCGLGLRGGFVVCCSAVVLDCRFGEAEPCCLLPWSPLRSPLRSACLGARAEGVGGASGGSTLRSIISSLAKTPRVPSGSCTCTSWVRICVPVTRPICSAVLTQIFLCGRHFFRSR